MKEIMKRVVAMILVTALVFGAAQTTQRKTAQAAGKYTLKVKNLTLEVGEKKSLNIKTNFKDYAMNGKVPAIGKLRGYWVTKTKCKVLKGKDKVKVTNGGSVTALKPGTVTIYVTAIYHDYISIANEYGENDGSTKYGKKHVVSRSVKVKVKKASPVPKDQCKVADKNMKLVLGSKYDDEGYLNAKTVKNKTKMFYVKPVLSYKVIDGEEHVQVKVNNTKNGMTVKAVSAGTAEIEVTTTYQLYQKFAGDGKNKLVDKNYATSTSKITVTVEDLNS